MAAMVFTLLATFTLVLGSSCAFVAPPIQMHGSPADLERLAGEWWGEYVGNLDHIRHGTISFKLIAGETHAHGDVVMIPDGSGQSYRRYPGGDTGSRPRTSADDSIVLAIRFVDAAEGTVYGELDPYWDPIRMTQASTTFRGRLSDNTIEGTFTARYANGAAQTGGSWRVTRTR